MMMGFESGDITIDHNNPHAPTNNAVSEAGSDARGGHQTVDLVDELADELADDLVDEGSSVGLFAGDEGGLDRAERDCLVYLLKHNYLSNAQRPSAWQTLMDSEPAIRSRLNDLYLVLHVDLEAQVAYKRQAVPDHGAANFPTLLVDRAYNREQTILLVYLRERLHQQRASTDGPVLVDREDMTDRVDEFRDADDTDLYAAQRRAENAIDALTKMGILEASDDGDRYAISPVLDSLMPLQRLQELLAWMRSSTSPSDSGGSSMPDQSGGEA